MWSAKNAEVLFKDSYTKEDDSYYGAVSLDRNSMVNNNRGWMHYQRQKRAAFHFHPNAFYDPLVFQLCFAYKGMLKDEVGLKFTYVNTNGQTETKTATINTVFAKGDT